jgi:hypothetical protein
MRREPRAAGATVALAGVDVYASVNRFALVIYNELPVKCVILAKWVVRPKAVGVDSHQLLLAV